jgi:asparagine synthase (glutamine-hydrolysing)
MSAIAGRWNFDGAPALRDCERMLDAQSLYGPDASDRAAIGSIAMGRRLYRLLPEDRYDRQPLTGGGGRFTLVADVRLDNREDLARTLGIDAERERRLCDADTLLAAWERWQERSFEHLLGDYAFAVWDARERRLTLARDHFGNRPLHYHLAARFVAFASMPKGLHALPEVPIGLDTGRIAESLVMMPEWGSRSFFERVSRVEAGCAAVICEDHVEILRHWRPNRPSGRTGSDPVGALREHLDRATKARMRTTADAVATQLSGGFDSAAVTATAARLGAERGQRIVAFTAVPRSGFVDPEPKRRIGDEGALAAETAALYPNVEHVRVRTEPGTPLDRLDADFRLFDRPVRNLCNQRWIAQINGAAQRRRLNVMLTGANGNMALTYTGNELLAELAGRGRAIALFRAARGLVRAGRVTWPGALDRAIGAWLPQPLWAAIHQLGGRRVNSITDHSAINPAVLQGWQLRSRARLLGFDLSYMPFRNGFDMRLGQMRRIDMGNYNKGMLAGWGVDYRDPMSDRLLIEYCLALPTASYLQDGVPRALAMKVLADRVPSAVLHERRRGMQAVDWFEGVDAAREAIGAEIALARAVPAAAETLDLDRMASLVADWPSEWRSNATVSAYRLALIRGVAAIHFIRSTGARRD